MLWRHQPPLGAAVASLKAHDGALWTRLVECLDAPSPSDATSLAHYLETVSSIFSLLAIEIDASTSDTESTNSTFVSKAKEWFTSSRITAWVDASISGESCYVDRCETQYAAQAFVLQCVLALERQEMTAQRVPLMADASLRSMCGQIRDALLAHPSAKDLRSSGASNVAILEAIAQESAAKGPGSIISNDPVHKLLVVAREMHVEAAVLAPAPLGITGAAEYG